MCVIKLVSQIKEIGYPHELILLAIKKVENLRDGQYTPKTKAFSNVFLSLLNEPLINDVDFIQNYLELELLHNYFKKGYPLKKKINDHLNNLFDIFIQSTGSSNKFESLEDFLIFSFFFVIISDNPSLIKQNFLMKLTSNNLIPNNSTVKNLSELLLILQLKTFDDSKLHQILVTINSLTEIWLKIYLSYKCSFTFENHKELFLINHYSILKDLMDTYAEAFEHPHLSDQVFEDLFKISTSLFISGYNKSLRINIQEKMNYQESVLKQKSIITVYETHYDNTMRVFKIKIQRYLLIISILIVLFSFLNIWAPLGISLGTIEFVIPVEFPIVIMITIALLSPVIIKLFKAKKNISKKLSQGETKND